MKRTAEGERAAGDSVRSALEELEGLRGCRVGLRAVGLEGPLAGVGFGLAEEEAFPSASLIKVLVLLELLRQADSGMVSLGEEAVIRPGDLVEDSEMLGAGGLPARVPLRELAEGMITVSDNTATNRLIRRLGMDRIDALAWELGLRRTSLRREMMDFAARSRGEENTTSASDMVALMREVWGGPILARGSRELALGLLLGQRLVSRIAFRAPPGARYAHKTGELDGVENDAGILLVPELRGGRAGRGQRRPRGGARIGGARGHLRVLRRRGPGVGARARAGRMYEHCTVLHASGAGVVCGYARTA